MSFAPNYSPTVGFATEESNSVAGRSTVRTVAVDNELANISSSINAINTNLKKLQRDDGKPADFLVEPYALSEQTRALITAGGNPRGIWLPATAYAAKDCVQYAGIAYICITNHTSAGVFDVNLWMAISGDGSASASATAAATSATNAASSATAAATSATNAANSATAAATSATNASNSATASANSASAAATNKTATDANVTASGNSATAAANSATAAAGSATAAANTPVAVPTHAATTKATPVDADEFPLIDSAASWGLKKFTWANIKTAISAYLSSSSNFISGATEDTAPDSDADYVLTYDASGPANKKVPIRQIHGMKYSTFGTNTTLDSTQDGKHLGTSTDGLTVTLPQISTVRDGYMVAFSLNADLATGLTIQRGGTDQIVIGGTTINSLKMTKFGDVLVLVASALVGRWLVLHDGINGPYFQASFNGTQAAPTLGAYTKLSYGNEISDSHECYNGALYRFTPSIPGWYQVTAAAWMVTSAAKRCGISIYKNSATYMQGNRAYISNDGKIDVNCMVYLNGSTDYIEAYVNQSDTASGITDVDGAGSGTMPNFTARRIK